MNLRQLEYLDALARERHFGRAAAACHVSQPALSAAVRRLEQELGLTLVRRSQSFDELTAEGSVVLGWARRVMSNVSALEREASELRGEINGTIRLGVIPTAIPAVAIVTEPLLQRHPGIDLQVRSLNAEAIARGLGAHELDCGITYLDEDPVGPAVSLELYSERYYLMAAAGGIGAGRADIGWRELEHEPLCLLTPDMQNRRIVDAAFAQAGVSVRPRVQANTTASLMAFARRGYPCVVAHTWLAVHNYTEELDVVPLVAPEVSYRIGLVTLPIDPPSPLVRTLRADVGAASADGSIEAAIEASIQGWLAPS